MERRIFAGLVALGGTGWGLNEWLRGPVNSSRVLPASLLVAGFDSSGRSTGTAEMASIRRSDAEWKSALAVDQYMVTRRSDTELAFAGEYWNLHLNGLYRCVCCATALFDSQTKFNSGTGWPSFTEPIAKENVRESVDYGFGVRTEVSCARCGAHLGHVFEDGPPPTHRRFCMNSVAMKFVART